MSAYAKRPRDWAFMSWIKSQQCCVCEKLRLLNFGTIYAHHAGERAFGRKADDRTCIPLCWRHHDRASSASIHSLGKRFWGTYGLDRFAIIEEINQRFEAESGSLAAWCHSCSAVLTTPLLNCGFDSALVSGDRYFPAPGTANPLRKSPPPEEKQ